MTVNAHTNSWTFFFFFFAQYDANTNQFDPHRDHATRDASSAVPIRLLWLWVSWEMIVSAAVGFVWLDGFDERGEDQASAEQVQGLRGVGSGPPLIAIVSYYSLCLMFFCFFFNKYIHIISNNGSPGIEEWPFMATLSLRWRPRPKCRIVEMNEAPNLIWTASGDAAARRSWGLPACATWSKMCWNSLHY